MAKAFLPSDGESTTDAAATGASLKRLLRSKKVLVGGMASEYLRPSLMKLYHQAGFDFVFIEYEHCWFDSALMSASVLCARDIGLPVIAKTPQLDRAEIAKLLECGVMGIQLPRTESRADVETLRNYMKFEPQGSRAIAPGYGSSDYRRIPDWRAWMDQQNEETLLIVHIETRAGYENAEEIISTAGVDMAYIGPGDFSIAMGCPGDYDHDNVRGPMEEILALCRRYGVPFGTTASGVEAARCWISRGARFFETTDELALIHNAASQLVRQYRAAEAEQ